MICRHKQSVLKGVKKLMLEYRKVRSIQLEYNAYKWMKDPFYESKDKRKLNNQWWKPISNIF